MFRIYGSTLGPLALALAITAVYYLLTRRKHVKEIPGPPWSLEFIRWRASLEDTEEDEG